MQKSFKNELGLILTIEDGTSIFLRLIFSQNNYYYEYFLVLWQFIEKIQWISNHIFTNTKSPRCQATSTIQTQQEIKEGWHTTNKSNIWSFFTIWSCIFPFFTFSSFIFIFYLTSNLFPKNTIFFFSSINYSFYILFGIW